MRYQTKSHTNSTPRMYLCLVMLRKVLHSKIHHARCTGAVTTYVGSITIDLDIIDAIGLRASDCVLVANCRNGERFETYVFEGKRGSGIIEVNGAAAHLAEPGDKLIIMHFAYMTDEEYAKHRPQVVVLDENNRIAEKLQY